MFSGYDDDNVLAASPMLTRDSMNKTAVGAHAGAEAEAEAEEAAAHETAAAEAMAGEAAALIEAEAAAAAAESAAEAAAAESAAEAAAAKAAEEAVAAEAVAAEAAAAKAAEEAAEAAEAEAAAEAAAAKAEEAAAAKALAAAHAEEAAAAEAAVQAAEALAEAEGTGGDSDDGSDSDTDDEQADAATPLKAPGALRKGRKGRRRSDGIAQFVKLTMTVLAAGDVGVEDAPSVTVSLSVHTELSAKLARRKMRCEGTGSAEWSLEVGRTRAGGGDLTDADLQAKLARRMAACEGDAVAPGGTLSSQRPQPAEDVADADLTAALANRKVRVPEDIGGACDTGSKKVGVALCFSSLRKHRGKIASRARSVVGDERRCVARIETTWLDAAWIDLTHTPRGGHIAGADGGRRRGGGSGNQECHGGRATSRGGSQSKAGVPSRP